MELDVTCSNSVVSETSDLGALIDANLEVVGRLSEIGTSLDIFGGNGNAFEGAPLDSDDVEGDTLKASQDDVSGNRIVETIVLEVNGVSGRDLICEERALARADSVAPQGLLVPKMQAVFSRTARL